jgi:hypothetical protein
MKGNKMFNSIVRTILLFFIFIIFQSCDSPTAVIETQDFDNSYTPLKVGIEKQYFYYWDSTYQNSKISGKAYREDRQEVFIEESNTLINPNQVHSSYLFIRDGYLYSTSLVKKFSESNPCGEIRISKVYPKDGDSWYSNQSAPDSAKLLITSKYVGDMITPAGTFKDVVSMQYIDESFGYPDTVNVYYVKGIGHIGSSSQFGLALVNYVKIGDKVYGVQEQIVILPKR